MTILLTGGAGFIGSHLAERLLNDGHTVVCLDNLDNHLYRSCIKKNNLAKLLYSPSFIFVQEDIRNKASVARILQQYQCQVVIHLAAYAGVRASVQEPLTFAEINVNGTLSILEAMRETDTSQLIFASSSSVYGNSTAIPFREIDTLGDPVSPYAATKRAGELLAYTYHSLYGFKITCLRLFTVYGPRQRPEMAISQFIRKIEAAQPIDIYGDGSTLRNYTYVADAVTGFMKALVRLEGFQIINIGGQTPIHLRDLVAVIEKVTHKKAELIYHPTQAGDMEYTIADLSLAKQALDYAPTVSIEQGIKEYLDWIKNV